MTPAAVVHTDPENVAEIMSMCDLALGAGGISATERCCLALPTLAVELADNQSSVLSSMHSVGALRHLGRLETVGADILAGEIRMLMENTLAREKMARAAAVLCDGYGLTRVLGAIEPKIARDSGTVRLRPLTEEDGDAVLDWQNHPHTRQYFRNPNKISPVEHKKWLKARLADPGCFLNLVLHDGKPAGLVRLDPATPFDGRNYEVSILIDPARRGLGIGKMALQLATGMIHDARYLADIHAENGVSITLFESVGFSKSDDYYVLDKQ